MKWYAFIKYINKANYTLLLSSRTSDETLLFEVPTEHDPNVDRTLQEHWNNRCYQICICSYRIASVSTPTSV